MKTVMIATLLALAGSVRAEQAVKLTHDWPGYAGPDGTFTVPGATPILPQLREANLAWVNEQADLGFAKTTSGGGHCCPGTMKASGS